MDLGLQGAVVVVTGASKGIGLAITQGFVREGARVVAGARSSSPELDELLAEGSVEVVLGDLGDPDAPARLVEAAGERVDVLVNNVGIATPRPGGFLEVTDEMWQTALTLNLMAAVRATRAVLPIMLDAGRGSIVNIGSVNARLPDPLVVDYSAAKGALVNLSKSLSKEFGPRGIRVNTIAPGPVATDLWLGKGGVAERVGAASGRSPEDIAAAAAKGMVTGRFTRASEVADLVLYLAGDVAANVTGSDVTIDGGLTPML